MIGTIHPEPAVARAIALGLCGDECDDVASALDGLDGRKVNPRSRLSLVRKIVGLDGDVGGLPAAAACDVGVDDRADTRGGTDAAEHHAPSLSFGEGKA